MDIHVLQSQPAQKVAFKDSSTVRVGNKLVRNKPPTQPSAMRPKRNSNAVKSDVQTASEAGVVVPPAQPTSCHLVRGGFQPRLPTSLPPPGQQQQPSPLPRRQPVPLMPPAQLHPGAPQVVAPAPAVPLQSPPPSELMDVDPSAGPPSQVVAVQPVLQPLSLGTPKESDTAAPCPAPTQQPSTQHLVRGGFQPRLPTSLPPPGQQQQPSPLPRRQPVPLMPPAQLHPGAPQVVAPAPAVPLQSPPPSELMDVDPSAGPPSQVVAVQPVLQPLSLGTPKESDTAAPCPAPTQQPSTQPVPQTQMMELWSQPTQANSAQHILNHACIFTVTPNFGNGAMGTNSHKTKQAVSASWTTQRDTHFQSFSLCTT
ncbi:vegetative cell wall protein gp1-like [Schistocerca americana]|uniref:vegetative cell wall protein gp1-like n=1 Tax=Schistocerca americana TaxID=7009 RepID=UPI001F4F2189|nr:vegetative cell wall protein gp1-like [Schistocerca americana]